MKPNPKLGLFAEVGIPPTPRPQKDKNPVPVSFPEYIDAEFGLLCFAEVPFHQGRKWRFDFAIPSLKIAIEQEGATWIGGRHTRPSTYHRDVEKYNHAAAAGWLLIRATPQNLFSVEIKELIKQAINTRRAEANNSTQKGQ